MGRAKKPSNLFQIGTPLWQYGLLEGINKAESSVNWVYLKRETSFAAKFHRRQQSHRYIRILWDLILSNGLWLWRSKVKQSTTDKKTATLLTKLTRVKFTSENSVPANQNSCPGRREVPFRYFRWWADGRRMHLVQYTVNKSQQDS